MALNNGERQVAADVSGIRRDHVARYEFAARQLKPGSRVLDLACGVGYGSKILAEASHHVVAVDCSDEAIEYAQEHYAHERVSFHCQRADWIEGLEAGQFDAVVCFETIEHIEEPEPILSQFRRLAPLLIASVPNEDQFHHQGRIAFHFRHYRPFEFKQLVEQAGFVVRSWHGQEGRESEVEADLMGRTIMVVAERGEASNVVELKPLIGKHKAAGAPKHVALVGMGPSAVAYFDAVSRIGGRSALCDEVWSINALGDVLACDRIFHMDDVRIQEIRAAERPKGNIANMLKWMRKHPGPIYTSRAHPDYPGLVEFPLEDVLNDLGYDYFNSTAAWAIAYAIHIGVERIDFWGFDFTYPNAHHAEKGRACCEYWIGRAMAKGIRVSVTTKSTLLDACEPAAKRLYGYDTVDVKIAEQPDRSLKVTLKERPELPTADEIEHEYDHSRHPAEKAMG